MNTHQRRQLSPQSRQILEEILQEAEELRTPIIQDEGIHFMIDKIVEHKVKKVLEIGSAIGYSAIMMALHTDADILTIERDSDSCQRAKDNIRRSGLESRITLIHGDALEIDFEEDYHCDLLFIDAAKAQYIKFFERYAKYLSPGGIVMADNLSFHGLVDDASLIQTKNQRKLVEKIRTFNEFILNHSDYDTTIYPIGDGISISVKKQV